MTAKRRARRVSLSAQNGYFGEFGGRYVPETLTRALNELVCLYVSTRKNRHFRSKLAGLLRDYVGRPTPLYYAENLSRALRGARIYLKREDLCHTGSHKLNNTIGQGLLAVTAGKKRMIAETGAGQHGVACATAARIFGLSCDVYMGEEDIRRQSLNVFRMKLLGARVIPVSSGSKTLKDATNEAIRDWVANVDSTYYLLGSVVGPHPYPMMVRDFQKVIGEETKKQIQIKIGRLPDAMIACVGGGSNSIGFFYPFLRTCVELIGVEAAGEGLSTGRHAASLAKGSIGILHGMKSFLLQTKEGQVRIAHSISAGLDYPSVGPEHARLKTSGRVRYTSVTDDEAVRAFHQLTRLEGIVPALESAHAVAYAVRHARTLGRKAVIAVCLSGRGDKDIQTVENYGA